MDRGQCKWYLDSSQSSDQYGAVCDEKYTLKEKCPKRKKNKGKCNKLKQTQNIGPEIQGRNN